MSSPAVTSSPFFGRLPIKSSLALLLILVGSLIYLPGLSGPFLFDDMQNIVNNHFVHISRFNPEELFTAAFSTSTGPLKRPIAMLSFALNYYANGGVDDPLLFKATNIAIHAVNGLLVYWLCYLIFLRLSTASTAIRDSDFNKRLLHVAAASTALLWVVHPIQLTSVLYVVQRMTSLSATFMLLGLIGYMVGRLRIERQELRGTALAITSVVVGCTLASFTKETGFLLPLYALTLEATLFRTSKPWSRWKELSLRNRRLISAMLLLMGLISLVLVTAYAFQNYGQRPFTPLQRVLTETRVLWFYLFLMVVPDLSRFGLNHDDVVISTSLAHPWTTLPATIGLVALFLVGVFLRKRQPLFALGILWFFIGHSLESTVFALEIAHEHRNYLPSLGIVLAGVQFVRVIAGRHASWRPWLAALAISTLFAAITVIRSSEWSDLYSFAAYEADHHPRSPRAQAYLGQALMQLGRFEDGGAAYRRAAELDPSEASYLMVLVQIPPFTEPAPTPSEQQETLRRLVAKKITPGAMLVLHTVNACILQRCAFANVTAEKWARALLAADIPGQDDSFYYHLLGRSLASQGRTPEALEALVRSYTLDPKYLYPRIDAVKLLLNDGQLRKAEKEMSGLVAANKRNRFSQDQEVANLSAVFDDLRRRNLLTN